MYCRIISPGVSPERAHRNDNTCVSGGEAEACYQGRHRSAATCTRHPRFTGEMDRHHDDQNCETQTNTVSVYCATKTASKEGPGSTGAVMQEARAAISEMDPKELNQGSARSYGRSSKQRGFPSL
jgi:hypothetical protein